MNMPRMGAAGRGRGQPAPTAKDTQRTGKRTSKRAQRVSPQAVRAWLEFYAPTSAMRRRA